MKHVGLFSFILLVTLAVSCSPIVNLGLELFASSVGVFSNVGGGGSSSPYVDPKTVVLSIDRDSLVFHSMEYNDTITIKNLLDEGMSFTIKGEKKGDPFFSNLQFSGLKDDGYGGLYDILSSKETRAIRVVVKDRNNVGNSISKIIIQPGGEYTSKLEVPVRIETTIRDMTASVSGKVMDEAGVPYENVTVLLRPFTYYDIEAYTKTDSYGEFVFNELTPGIDMTFSVVSRFFQPQDVRVAAVEKGRTGVCNFTLKLLQHHLVVDKDELNFGETKKDDPSRTETITVSMDDNHASGFWITICKMGEPGSVGTDIQSAGIPAKGVKVKVTFTPSDGAPGPHQQFLLIDSNNGGNMLIPVKYTIVE